MTSAPRSPRWRPAMGGKIEPQPVRGRLMGYRMVEMRAGPLQVEFELFSLTYGTLACTISHDRFPRPPRDRQLYIAVGYLGPRRELFHQTMQCTHLIPAWNQEFK